MKSPGSTFPSYSCYTVGQLLIAYANGPSRVRHVLEGLSDDEARARPRGDFRWSAHEIAMHLADSELQGLYRFRKIWSESGAELPGYDQDAWAVGLAYQNQLTLVREHALQLFEQLRVNGAELFQRADGADWNRWGIHPDHGRVTLHNMLELYADHSERHIAQILETRRLLGKAIDFPLLLAERLY